MATRRSQDGHEQPLFSRVQKVANPTSLFGAPKRAQESPKSLPGGQSTVIFACCSWAPFLVPFRARIGSILGAILVPFSITLAICFWIFFGIRFGAHFFNYFLDPPNRQNLNSAWGVLRFLACGGKGLVTPNYKKKGTKTESKHCRLRQKTCQKNSSQN